MPLRPFVVSGEVRHPDVALRVDMDAVRGDHKAAAEVREYFAGASVELEDRVHRVVVAVHRGSGTEVTRTAALIGPDGRIDYIEFRAANLEETKAFYGGVFSWKFTDYGPEYTSFEDGRLAGGFQHGSATPGVGTLAVIYAVDLEAMQSKIEQAGGTIVKPIFSFPGGRRFHFQDPSGNELAVWSDNLDPSS